MILKLKCWNCDDFIFPIPTEENDKYSPNFVKVLVPCPVCDKICQLVLREDQVLIQTVMKNGKSVNIPNIAALEKQVFLTTNPE